MPNTRAVQLAFNAGEVSPEMYGRVDQKAHQSGLKTCRNMYIKPQGAAKRRPGLAYVGNAVSNSAKSRLIPFQGESDMVLEVSANAVRFYRSGAQIALAADNYFVARACTVNTGTGIWTLSTGNLDNLPNDARITIYGLTAANVGALYTNVNQGPAQVASIAGVGAWQWSTTGSFFTTTSPHGLRQNDAVIMQETASLLRWFYVDVLTETSFRIRVGSQQTGVYTGPLPAWATSTLTMWKAVTPSSTIGISSLYYIEKLSSTTFKIKESLEAATINSYASDGTNSFTVAAYYPQGSLRLDQGLSNYYQTNAATFSSSAATAAWVNYGINNNSTTTWSLVSSASGLTHPNNYSDTQLMELTYAQDNNKLTLTHRNKPTLVLTRLTDLQWSWAYANYAPPIASPTGVTATAFGAVRIRCSDWRIGYQTTVACAFKTSHDEVVALVPGDTVKFFCAPSGNPGTLHEKVQNNTFTVTRVYSTAANASNTVFEVKANSQTNLAQAGLGIGQRLEEGTTAATISPEIFAELWPDDSQALNYYVVTAVDDNNVESQPSAQVAIENNLFARETYNVLTWTQVPGARRYNIYKRTSGLFGWIGQADTAANVTFKDDNITPDLSRTPAILDTSLAPTSNAQLAYPGAVTYFEQRKVLAGTVGDPSKIWMTRSNTDQDLSFGIPLKDTDRIALTVKARNNNVIRHLVSSGELLVLTDQSEWRITAINSDAVTPTTIAVRPQSYIGANFVTPAIINNVAVFCAAMGGHVRQMGFNFNAQGYTTADLSLRASHLFDDYTLTDLAYMRSPLPIAWFVSSSGKLLGMTYIPEEEVAAWHQHDTDGVVESVACIKEGDVDSLYCVVLRTTNGSPARYIERMTDVRATGSADNYLDSSRVFDGTHVGGRLLVVTELNNGGWQADASVTISDSLGGSVFAGTDVGDYLELRANGLAYRVQITQRISSVQARGRLMDPLPVALRNTPIASWAWARATFSGASNLAGRTIEVVADGDILRGITVDASGAFVLPVWATKVTAGIWYQSVLETLPVAMQVDGLGQGRTKNINKAWLRVDAEDSGFYIGPNQAELVEEDTLPATATSLERQVTLLPAWGQDGSIVVSQSNPVGLTVNGIVMEVAVGS
jgi:hypothetical protein